MLAPDSGAANFKLFNIFASDSDFKFNLFIFIQYLTSREHASQASQSVCQNRLRCLTSVLTHGKRLDENKSIEDKI